jgi:hypothetical protein
MGFPTNRMVAVLTPLVFAPLAGTISVLAAKYLPGVKIDQGSLTAVFIAGATIAFGKAALWMKGWQAWEQHEQIAAPADSGVAEDVADLEPDGVEDDAGADEEIVDDDDIDDDVAALPVAA